MVETKLCRLFWDTAYCTGLTPWDTGEPPSHLRILVEKGYIKPCRAIDLGCGTGTSTIYLSKMGFEVYGVDISREAIKKAVKKARDEGVKCSFIVGDITSPNFVDGIRRFKLAIDVGCLHSLLTWEARNGYRRTLDKLLDRGGILLLWAFDRGFPGPPGLRVGDVSRILGDGYKIIAVRRFWWQVRWGNFYIIKKIG